MDHNERYMRATFFWIRFSIGLLKNSDEFAGSRKDGKSFEQIADY
jgi:hypothetical protein